MNRSILIVICDFLLVSLLAFSTVDINKATDSATPPQVKTDLTMSTNQPETGRDLSAVMRLALEDEKQKRDLLLSELSQARGKVGQQQQELQSRAQQVAAAQENIQALNQQLQSSTEQAARSSEKLADLEAELKRRAELAAALQKQLSESNQIALAERQRLSGELELAELERRHAAEQVKAMQDQVNIERAEKAKLAEGVKALAAKSGELTQEIRENRPLAANTIYSDFVSNRVQASFTATRSGLFGAQSSKHADARTVLVSDGVNTYALGHVEDTPLALWLSGPDWEGLSGTLSRGMAAVPVRSLSFHQQDPRVVFVPLTVAEAKQLGGTVYRASADPYKFEDAVLIGTREDYYGECKFEIDTGTPGYVKLDRSVLRGLFGKFNPSRGDLVLSKRGELLGMMVNNTYCLMLKNFDPETTLQFGADVKAQHTGATLSSLYGTVQQMPFKLQ